MDRTQIINEILQNIKLSIKKSLVFQPTNTTKQGSQKVMWQSEPT